MNLVQIWKLITMQMATEQYFKHVRPLQGSLSTMGATKSINTRYADTIRSQLLKRVQKWGIK